MTRGACLLFLLLAACGGDAPDASLRLATVESPETVGLTLRELPPSVLKSVGLSYGLAVVRAAGPADQAGLRMGDVVYGVNEKKINNLDDFRRLVGEHAEGRKISLLVRRGKSDFYVAVDLGTLPRPFESLPKPGPAARDTLLRT